MTTDGVPSRICFGVLNSDDLRTAYEEVLSEVVAFSLRFSQSKPIYDALCALRDGDEWNKLDEAQHRIIDAKILSMKLSGIGLEGEQQDRFNEIAKELSQLSTDFSNHVLDATRAFGLVVTDVAETEGMPESLRAMGSANYNEKREEGQPESTPDAGTMAIHTRRTLLHRFHGTLSQSSFARRGVPSLPDPRVCR